MIDAKITIICQHGRNLSKYLKDYLKTKDILSYNVGMHFKNQSVRQKIKKARTIICVHPDIKKAAEAEFDLSEKHVICLDVVDTPESAKSKPLTGDLWVEHQKEYVYPELERQIKKHLKKLTN